MVLFFSAECDSLEPRLQLATSEMSTSILSRATGERVREIRSTPRKSQSSGFQETSRRGHFSNSAKYRFSISDARKTRACQRAEAYNRASAV